MRPSFDGNRKQKRLSKLSWNGREIFDVAENKTKKLSSMKSDGNLIASTFQRQEIRRLAEIYAESAIASISYRTFFLSFNSLRSRIFSSPIKWKTTFPFFYFCSSVEYFLPDFSVDFIFLFILQKIANELEFWNRTSDGCSFSRKFICFLDWRAFKLQTCSNLISFQNWSEYQLSERSFEIWYLLLILPQFCKNVFGETRLLEILLRSKCKYITGTNFFQDFVIFIFNGI